MNNTDDKAYILIDKFHSGIASQDEVSRLNQWRNSSSNNSKLYDEIVLLLDLLNSLKSWRQFDKSKAWYKLQSRMGSKGLRISRQIMAAAAIFLFVLAATLWNFSGGSAVIESSHISGMDAKFSILKDGSEMFLSENAKIFTNNFSEDSRFLRTEGSYFVHVSHNESSPFTLETDRISLKVLGTSFKVQENIDETIVKVRDGKVLITSYDGSEYTLTAGEQLVASQNNVTIGKVGKEDWGLFSKSYEDESLFTLFNDLSEEYGNLKISAGSINASCRITTKIQQSTIIEILEELELLFDVNYSVKDGIVAIQSISC